MRSISRASVRRDSDTLRNGQTFHPKWPQQIRVNIGYMDDGLDLLQRAPPVSLENRSHQSKALLQ